MSDFLSTKSTMVAVKRQPGWITDEEATLAQSSGYLYGDKAEGTLGQGGRGKIVPSTKLAMRELNRSGGPEFDDTTSPLTGEQKSALWKAKLAADKSPVAALGFDLMKTQVTPKGAGFPLTIAGAYSPKKDVIWADGSYESAPVHESIHRGMEELRKSAGDEAVDNALKDKFGVKLSEEIVTRAMMLKHFGDVEKTEDPNAKAGNDQIERGRWILNNRPEVLDKLDKLAQEEIKKRKPMGPR